jgi:hypothetical protein
LLRQTVGIIGKGIRALHPFPRGATERFKPWPPLFKGFMNLIKRQEAGISPTQNNTEKYRTRTIPQMGLKPVIAVYRQPEAVLPLDLTGHWDRQFPFEISDSMVQFSINS